MEDLSSFQVEFTVTVKALNGDVYQIPAVVSDRIGCIKERMAMEHEEFARHAMSFYLPQKDDTLREIPDYELAEETTYHVLQDEKLFAIDKMYFMVREFYDHKKQYMEFIPSPSVWENIVYYTEQCLRCLNITATHGDVIVVYRKIVEHCSDIGYGAITLRLNYESDKWYSDVIIESMNFVTHGNLLNVYDDAKRVVDLAQLVMGYDAIMKKFRYFSVEQIRTLLDNQIVARIHYP